MPKQPDQVLRTLLDLPKETEPALLSESERATIEISKRAPARDEFATDAEVSAVWAKHGL